MSPRPSLFRLIVPFAVMIMIVIGVCGSVVYWAGQRNVRLEQIHDLDRLAALARGMLSGQQGEDLTAEQRKTMRDLADVLETRITIIGGDGVVMLDTHHNAEAMENHNARPEVVEARQSGMGSSVRHSDTIDEDAVYVAELLDPGDHDGVVVRLSFPEHVWARAGVPPWTIVFAGTLTAALLMAWLAWLLQRQWIGPVRELAGAADRMAAGEWDTRVEPGGADAVRFLGNRFNIMAAHAETQVSDLNHQRADLQALVDSLPDPILLSDAQDRIVVINAPAAALLQLTPVQALGKRVNVVVNEEAILKVIEQVRDGSSMTRELRLQRGGQRVTFQAVATGAQSGGVLLVLRNVTAMATTVQMKTDFVANASHELRTPIAAIKVAFETLQDVYTEDPQQTERCVAIIGGQLRRLEEMLRDLLDLSRVENPELKPQIAPVNMPDLVSFVRTALGPAARGKEVELEFIADEWGDAQEFDTDCHLVELVLKNLVENSIKFTPAGGKVTVRLSRGQGGVVIEVTDTGIGIPPEQQERVFERFYQVDAARSSSAGRGTGLGLAIVKHAIHALGGTVQLSSALNVGTKVRCILPELPIAQEIAAEEATGG